MQLLMNMSNLSDFLVVDHGDEIKNQYERNLSRNGWVSKLLAKFVSRGRVHYVSGHLSARIYNRLRSLEFDDDDDVFVAVAGRTLSGLLVAEESDYSPQVVDYLSDQAVRVVDCALAKAESSRQTS